MANPNPEDEITAERRVYDYDNIGNRQSFTAAAGDPLYYCANKLNQYDYTDETTSCPPSQPTDSFDYDGDGNLIDDGTFEYSWDAENRLIELATRVELGEDEEDYDEGDKKLQFAYDYMGRRVRKTAWTYNGSTWVEDTDRLFVYDGWNVVLVLDANDSNVTLTKYTWGLDVSGTLGGAGGIGGLLSAEETQGTSETSDDKRYWFFHDANGNVTQILDATNLGGTITLAAHCEYDPYGHTIVANDVNESGYVDDNPFRFSTKWLDTELAASAQTGAIGETGLYYYGYRYYSPSLGRWINRDPIEELGGLNLYEFVLNAPANYIDPDGFLVEIDIRGKGSRIRDLKTGLWISREEFASRVADGKYTPSEISQYKMAFAKKFLDMGYGIWLSWLSSNIINAWQDMQVMKDITAVCNGACGHLSVSANGNVVGTLENVVNVTAPSDWFTHIVNGIVPWGIPLSFEYHAHGELKFVVRCRVDPEPKVVWAIRPKITLTSSNGQTRTAYGQLTDSGVITQQSVVCACCANAP